MSRGSWSSSSGGDLAEVGAGAWRAASARAARSLPASAPNTTRGARRSNAGRVVGVAGVVEGPARGLQGQQLDGLDAASAAGGMP